MLARLDGVAVWCPPPLIDIHFRSALSISPSQHVWSMGCRRRHADHMGKKASERVVAVAEKVPRRGGPRSRGVVVLFTGMCTQKRAGQRGERRGVVVRRRAGFD